uniref:Fuzzy planar cell polarity protein n=1 Tax=Equus caballus TaxID=9796 RepID=A0A9L0R4D6_HORSE
MGEEGTEGIVHLMCLAASSGVPLFCRSSRGGAPARQQLPFSVIGSLNGVHMFGQNLEVQLSSARTEDTTVVWKSFHDSITLIVLSPEEGTSELRLERLLQMVFGAMVLLVGLEELTNIRNVERLKKELRASYRLIDSFLGDSELIGDLTQCVDCVVPPEGSLLQSGPYLAPEGSFYTPRGPRPFPGHSPPVASIAPWTRPQPLSLVFEDLWNLTPTNLLTLTSANRTDHLPLLPHARNPNSFPAFAHAVPFAWAISVYPSLNTALADSPGPAASQQCDSQQVT